MDPIHKNPLALAKSGDDEIITWNDSEINDWSKAEALLIRGADVTREKMIKAPNLKIVAKHGVGVETIDVDAANELGIVVTNTPDANMESVAEMAVTFILMLSRCIPKSLEMFKEGFKDIGPSELTGMELFGKTVALIGLGKIGTRTGEILKSGFNMELVGYDPYVSGEKAKELGINKFESLSDMLSISDIVNISVPLLKTTINLINKKQFSMMKESAILINTSRGKIVNEKDLYEALINNKIRGAALDVFEIEPPQKDNPLFQLSNFIGTPHIGATTEEALIKMGQTALEEIYRVRDGKKPLYGINI